ncbi:FAD/NAD(P)-binding domain-containing protein [Mycena chlorophos]|uniref:L-ornithine N(5)-monooxygenase [NAD(P)H] n=1 Tax=Mycena chlorophos TaxID=658473 RepID=A0A8H6SHG0_MYCCL|nr:FAD/NAD(P)-binding domain-containing protein [Mycena chlorophos]
MHAVWLGSRRLLHASPRPGHNTIPRATTPNSLFNNLLSLWQTPRTASLPVLVDYHELHRDVRSTRSYNLLISLALSYRSYGTVNLLFKGMALDNIPENIFTAKLKTRYLIRRRSWEHAWRQLCTEYRQQAIPLSLWLELFANLKQPSPAQDEQEQEPEQIRRTRRRRATPETRFRTLMLNMPTFTPEGPKSAYSVLVIVRGMLAAGRPESATALAVRYFHELPEHVDRRWAAKCVLVIDAFIAHEAHKRGGPALADFYSARRKLNSMLALHPDLRPTAKTLAILLSTLRRTRQRGAIAWQTLAKFTSRWGPGVEDQRVRRRVASYAVIQGRLDIFDAVVAAQERIQSELARRRVPAGAISTPTTIRRISPAADKYPIHPDDAIPFNVLQSTMAKLLRGKVVVGHSIWEHLSASGRVSGEEVSAYMQAFAREFLPNGVIRYGANVVKLRRDDSVWYVTVEDVSTKTREVLEYARIVLCTGGCDAPEIPKPLSASAAQQAGFQGQIVHSKDFAASLPIVESAKSIVIVGGGRSAQDMATHLANKGCTVSMVFEKADAFLAYPVALPAFLRRSRLLSIMAGHQFLNTKLERFLHTTALGSWLVFLLWSALRTASRQLLAVGINPFSRAGPGSSGGIRAPHIRPLFWSVHLNDDGIPGPSRTNNNSSHFYTLVRQGKIRAVVPARVVGFGADGRSVVAVTTDAGAEGRSEDVHLRADVLLLATGYKSSWTSLFDEKTAEKIGMAPTPLPVDSDASPFAYPHLSLTHRPPSPRVQSTKSVSSTGKRIWSLLHGIVPTKNISRRDFAINGAVFTTNVGYTFEVTSHWISSYFLGDETLMQNIPRGADLETHAKRKLGWMQLRYPDDALSMSESCGSFIAFWNWPQFTDDLLREMGLRTIRSGGNWFTWPFKTIDIDDELASLRDERAAKRSQAEA